MLLKKDFSLKGFFVANAFNPEKANFFIHILKNFIDIFSLISCKILSIIDCYLPFLELKILSFDRLLHPESVPYQ